MPFLDWINKNQAIDATKDVPYHLLKREESFGDDSKNLLIHGDNLLALKGLKPFFANSVKCIFVDPPYNTKQAFEHYDDNLEHSQWLSMVYPRLVLLRDLLTNDGLIFITISDQEVHYLKVLCDEIFGRGNFINEVSLRMKQTSGASGGGEDKRLKKNIEYLLIYVKDKDSFSQFNELFEEEDLFDLIEAMKDDGKSWKYTRILKSLGTAQYLKTIKDGSGEEIKIYAHTDIEIAPITKVAQDEGISEKECYFKYFDKIFRDTNAQSSIRTRVMESTVGEGDFFSIEYTPRSGRSKGKLTTLYYKGNNCDLLAWLSDVAVKKRNSIVKLEKLGTYWQGFPLNNLTKEGGVAFPNGKKPEALIKRVLDLCTEEGDLVLDSFLGSGTTAAVAHKMKRRYIGIEMGDQALTHCVPRLKKVIAGEQGGISPEVNWTGGGGFTYCTLANTAFTSNGQINPQIEFSTLASFVWNLETALPGNLQFNSPLLGIHDGVAYYLLYNGILGDKRPLGGNVLNNQVLKAINEIFPHDGLKVIYGESARLGQSRLAAEGITFKQIPYDINVL